MKINTLIILLCKQIHEWQTTWVRAYSSDPVRRDNKAATLLGHLHLFVPYSLCRLTLVTKLAT